MRSPRIAAWSCVADWHPTFGRSKPINARPSALSGTWHAPGTNVCAAFPATSGAPGRRRSHRPPLDRTGRPAAVSTNTLHALQTNRRLARRAFSGRSVGPTQPVGAAPPPAEPQPSARQGRASLGRPLWGRRGRFAVGLKSIWPTPITVVAPASLGGGPGRLKIRALQRTTRAHRPSPALDAPAPVRAPARRPWGGYEVAGRHCGYVRILSYEPEGSRPFSRLS